MLAWLFRWLGFRAVKKAVARRNGPPLLDIGFGFALLRDRRVPIASKALALMLGAAVTAGLVAMEVPIEGVIAFLLNIPGLGLDFLVDGLEILAGPLLFGALLLGRLAPAHIVGRLRAERYGQPIGPPIYNPVDTQIVKSV